MGCLEEKKHLEPNFTQYCERQNALDNRGDFVQAVPIGRTSTGGDPFTVKEGGLEF